jgi:hypothetical protein
LRRDVEKGTLRIQEVLHSVDSSLAEIVDQASGFLRCCFVAGSDDSFQYCANRFARVVEEVPLAPADDELKCSICCRRIRTRERCQGLDYRFDVVDRPSALLECRNK